MARPVRCNGLFGLAYSLNDRKRDKCSGHREIRLNDIGDNERERDGESSLHSDNYLPVLPSY